MSTNKHVIKSFFVENNYLHILYGCKHDIDNVFVQQTKSFYLVIAPCNIAQGF